MASPRGTTCASVVEKLAFPLLLVVAFAAPVVYALWYIAFSLMLFSLDYAAWLNRRGTWLGCVSYPRLAWAANGRSGWP